MAKYSLLTTLSLNAAGFTSNLDQAKKTTQSFKKGTEAASKSIASSFQNMGSVLGGVVNTEFAQLGTAIMGGVKAFKTMIPAIQGVKMALISSGIGAIVVALGLAFSGLMTWMKRTEAGSDTLAKAMLILKSVINTILNQVSLLGSAIVKLFKGDFKGAAEDAKQAVMGIGDEFEKNLTAAKNQFEAEENLEAFMIEYGMKRAKLEERIATLREQASEADNPQEKVKYLAEAKKLTDEIYGLDIQKSQLELEIINQKYAQQEKTSAILQEISDKQSEIFKIQAAQANEQRALNKQYVSATNEIKKQAEEAEKLKRELNEIAAIKPIKADNINMDMVVSVPENPFPAMMEKNTAAVSAFTDAYATSFEMLQGTIQNLQGKIGGFLEQYGQVVSGVFQLMNSSFDLMFSNLEQQEEEELKNAGHNARKKEQIEKKYAQKKKRIMLAQAIINGAMAITNGLLTTPFFPLGIIMGALAAALVAVQISKINSTQFASGGIVGGRSFTGDRVTARVNSGEMILNQAQQARLFDMANGRGGYGGQVTFEIEGKKLVGVLSNYNQYVTKTR